VFAWVYWCEYVAFMTSGLQSMMRYAVKECVCVCVCVCGGGGEGFAYIVRTRCPYKG